MKTIATLFAAAALTFGMASQSQANFDPFSMFAPQPKIVAKVSIPNQMMVVTVTNGYGKTQTFTWKVSTGKDGFDTPTGYFHPTWLDIDHTSDEYEDAPMPYAVFFTGGYAIHATEAVARLGTQASHGCVRLSPQNAETFFNLVKTYGKWNTKIEVID